MKKEVGKKPAGDYVKVEAYTGGNAAYSGTSSPKGVGVSSPNSVNLPENANPHPKEFGIGASKGRGIFNGS